MFLTGLCDLELNAWYRYRHTQTDEHHYIRVLKNTINVRSRLIIYIAVYHLNFDHVLDMYLTESQLNFCEITFLEEDEQALIALACLGK